MRSLAAAVYLAGVVFGGTGVGAEERDNTAVLRAALVRAVRGEILRRNRQEILRRDAQKPEVYGPADGPYMARKSYRRIAEQFDIADFQPPTARVRLAARVFEKRVTNVNEHDPVQALAAAPWQPAHVVYLLEGTWHWDGKQWRLRGALREQAVPAGDIPARQGLEKLLKRQMR